MKWFFLALTVYSLGMAQTHPDWEAVVMLTMLGVFGAVGFIVSMGMD